MPDVGDDGRHAEPFERPLQRDPRPTGCTGTCPGVATDRSAPHLRADRRASTGGHVNRRAVPRVDRAVPDPNVVVIGDSLLDHEWRGTADRLCPDSAGPVIEISSMRMSAGGAALAAVAAASTGARTTLVTAIGNDEAGGQVRNLLHDAGI